MCEYGNFMFKLKIIATNPILVSTLKQVFLRVFVLNPSPNFGTSIFSHENDEKYGLVNRRTMGFVDIRQSPLLKFEKNQSKIYFLYGIEATQTAQLVKYYELKLSYYFDSHSCN